MHALSIFSTLQLHVLIFHDLDIFIVCDNSIVHNQKLIVIITPLWMAVDVARSTMRGPSGVSDTNMAVEDILDIEAGLPGVDLILQVLHLPLGLDDGDLRAVVPVQGQTCTVITSIFKSL